MVVYRYSRWDGSQESTVDPDELLDALSDDLMSDGDLRSALQRVARAGLQQAGEHGISGLQDLLQQLRVRRQAELERYDLDSVVRDITDRIEQLVQREQEAIERSAGSAAHAPDEATARSLDSIAGRKREYLGRLPPDPAGAIKALHQYEFLDELAREEFQQLKRELVDHALDRYFEEWREALQALDREAIDRLTTMVDDLNALLERHQAGNGAGFDRFMQEHGRHFPGAHSVEDVIDALQQRAARMEGLLSGMSLAMRDALEDALASAVGATPLSDQLRRLAGTLRSITPPRSAPPGFGGEESIALDEALRLVEWLRDLDALEADIHEAQQTGDVSGLDEDKVGRLLGEEPAAQVAQLRDLERALEAAGYLERSDDGPVLTARAMRKIGRKALLDIFRNLKRDAFGRHAVSIGGTGSERTDDSKPYEFGDAFLLDLEQTLMNAVFRQGQGSPVRIAVDDFEVFKTEHLTRASTVLMLDMSRSMPLRGCFAAAKKVALALDSLIRTQYPRDDLYIVGFSDYARQLRPESLHRINWGDYVYGTNMQHGFLLARRLLGRQRSGTRQIILITDGEPTAHFEGDRVQFSYPPTFRTFQETLREVKRCTQEGIVINTFMLERSHYLAEFVNQMTRINRGRAFFATPERLGDYVLVDYVHGRNGASR